MFKTISGLHGVTILNRQAQKRITGGNMPAPGGCGIQIVDANGTKSWMHQGDTNGNGATIDEASTTGNGIAVYGPSGGVDFLGWTTGHWCCDSCPWNSPS